jgi:hypothetical protein
LSSKLYFPKNFFHQKFHQKRKTQEEELEELIQGKHRGFIRENIEPEQQTKNVAEEKFQEEKKAIEELSERINDVANSPAIRNATIRNLSRNSRKTDSLYQKEEQQTKNEAFNFSQSLQTHFSKGTLDKQPIEMFFESVNRNNNTYSVKGKLKTKTSDDFFHGMLTINSETTGALCADSETEINGIYNLYEEKGHFAGKFTACGNNTKLSKASFNGDWIKYSNGKKTPCNFGL